MKTDFKNYWDEKCGRVPELRDASRVWVINPTALKFLLRDAFEQGVLHHAQVTRDLSRQAATEARDKMLGPAALREDFEQIFGAKRAL